MSALSEAAYSKSLVSYVDILGFGDLIEESRTNVSKIAQIRDRLAQLRLIGDTPRRHRKHIDQKFASFNFSDLIVRSTSIESDLLWYDIVDWELFYLADQQMSLATQGVLVRGGISIGDVFVSTDEDIVFGPALVKSYKLERDYAIYPRIVLDRDLVLHARTRGFQPPLNDYIGRGEDGVYFLDYFFNSCVDGALSLAGLEDVRAQILSHRHAIEMAVNQASGRNERTRQKHTWLGLYHNSTVHRLAGRLQAGRIGNIGDLLVPEDAT